jgi:cysteine desulfuration protein SufE
MQAQTRRAGARRQTAITKGIVALVLSVGSGPPGARSRRQPTSPPRSRRSSLAGNLLSSNRTQGVPNMIALIRETASALCRQT